MQLYIKISLNAERKLNRVVHKALRDAQRRAVLRAWPQQYFWDNTEIMCIVSMLVVNIVSTVMLVMLSKYE